MPRAWMRAVGWGSFPWAGGTLLALALGGAERALLWGMGSGLAAAWLLLSLRCLLGTAPAGGGGEGSSGLGLPTWVTLARGYAAALLAGWILLPAPAAPGWWVAVVLFLVAALGDILDGWLARRRGQVTEVGRRLDGVVDALAMLVGIGVAVAWGRLPAPFLLLGAAPYLFQIFLAVLRRRGRPPISLPYRLSRRLAGAALFGWVAFALSPLPYPAWRGMGHALVAALVAGSFLRDGWTSVEGDPAGALGGPGS